MVGFDDFDPVAPEELAVVWDFPVAVQEPLPFGDEQSEGKQPDPFQPPLY